jgi:hypothetical protein
VRYPNPQNRSAKPDFAADLTKIPRMIVDFAALVSRPDPLSPTVREMSRSRPTPREALCESFHLREVYLALNRASAEAAIDVFAEQYGSEVRQGGRAPDEKSRRTACALRLPR